MIIFQESFGQPLIHILVVLNFGKELCEMQKKSAGLSREVFIRRLRRRRTFRGVHGF